MMSGVFVSAMVSSLSGSLVCDSTLKQKYPPHLRKIYRHFARTIAGFASPVPARITPPERILRRNHRVGLCPAIGQGAREQQFQKGAKR
jgi:hypothetical protein